MESGNFIAKYNWLVNKAKTYRDRKKDLKRGYIKHQLRGGYNDIR